MVRWHPDTWARKLDRLRIVAREAATQSRRATVPIIDPPADLTALAIHDETALAEPDGGVVNRSITTILVGPEGGWTPAELTAVAQHVKLAPTILRAATAAIAAGVLLIASHWSPGSLT